MKGENEGTIQDLKVETFIINENEWSSESIIHGLKIEPFCLVNLKR